MAKERQLSDAEFFPITNSELHRVREIGIRPMHTGYLCGACGKSTNGRVLCDFIRGLGGRVLWCLCSCDKREPTVLITDGNGETTLQLPIPREFHPGVNWPPDLEKLFREAALAYSAGAYTAASMTCRKLLMVCACHEGDADGKNFSDYVNHITQNVLSFPRAKAAIDAIRTIGNEANHQVKFVSQSDAKRSLEIMTYVLNTLYSLTTS